jgi:hypothetical protein
MSHRLKTISMLAAAVLGIAAISSAYAQQPTLSFTGEATPDPATPGNVIPKLSWTTTPAAASCTASGATNWTGTKAASGSVTLASVATPSPIYSLRCQWPGSTSAVLTWTQPTENTDGSALTNLSGYRVLYGPSPTALSQTILINSATATTHTVDQLTAGTWHFAITARASNGAESIMSETASRVITPPFEVTQSFGVKQPKPPTNLTVK